MFARSRQVLSLSNDNALVFVDLGLCGAMVTRRKLATCYMAETPPTPQNTSQSHAAGQCAHGPTGIADGPMQCMRPGVLLS